MSKAKRLFVTFQSELLNSKKVSEHFSKLDSFGDDICRFIIANFASSAIKCDQIPKEEEWGWSFCFGIEGADYKVLCQLEEKSAHQNASWLLNIYRVTNQWLYVLNITEEAVDIKATQAIHKALLSSASISEIRWLSQEEYDRNDAAAGIDHPD